MPAWVQERAWVNQRFQFGVEAHGAHGTAVAANRSIQAFSFDSGPEADLVAFGATGRKYDQIQLENMEWSGLTMSGPLDFNALIYPLNSIWGSISAATHGTSATAKDWIYTPPVVGSIEPDTYTIQQGDPNVRAHSFAYGLFTKFGYKLTRKDATVDGALIAQALSDAITMTNSPTAIALAPLAAKFWNISLDSSSANLGTTQLLRVISFDYEFDNVYGPVWVLNRSNLSFPAHVDLMPKVTIKLKVEADATGMSLLPLMQAGTTQYLRAQAIGAQIDNTWNVTLGPQSSGNFTLTYKGQTTSNIAFNATSASVQTALAALSSVPTGTVAVSGSAGGPYTITFSGVLQADTSALTATFTGLGTPSNASLTSQVVSNTLTHDMAVKIGKPSKFEDAEGLFAIEWELTMVEDQTWGKAQTATLTNLLTAL